MTNKIYDGTVFVMNLTDGKYKLTINQDNDSVDPREYEDRLTRMWCFSKRYNLGDKHFFSSIRESLESLVEEFVPKDKQEEVLAPSKDNKYSIKEQDVLIACNLVPYVCVKFIYMYDHSGITISTMDFKDPWDSCIVGIISLDKETALKEIGGADETNWYTLAENYIDNDVEEYDQWLTGDVYEYSLDKVVQCPHCKHEEEEHIDSMGGFYGNDMLTNGMLEYLDDEIVKHLKEVWNA